MSDTSKRLNIDLVNTNFKREIKKVFKDRFHLKLAYIDCDHFIKKSENTISELNKEKISIEEKLSQGRVNEKKANNKIKEIKDNIAIWNKKISDISKLKLKEGNIVNITVATFIECGKDFIYFTSGNLEKFSRFEGPYAITFEMMKYAIEKNFNYYNFYAQSSDFTEHAQDYRVLQFKRNFNGNIEWFMENYELKINLGKFI